MMRKIVKTRTPHFEASGLTQFVQPLKVQKSCIAAMISYNSFLLKTGEQQIRSMVEAAFELDNIDQLKPEQFDQALRFLVDIQIPSSLH